MCSCACYKCTRKFWQESFGPFYIKNFMVGKGIDMHVCRKFFSKEILQVKHFISNYFELLHLMLTLPFIMCSMSSNGGVWGIPDV